MLIKKVSAYKQINRIGTQVIHRQEKNVLHIAQNGVHPLTIPEPHNHKDLP